MGRLARLNELVFPVLGCAIHEIFLMTGGEGFVCPVAQESARLLVVHQDLLLCNVCKKTDDRKRY
jgi:hypothetical protein